VALSVRTLIFDAVVLDGTGAPPRPGCSVILEDHLVEEVVQRYAPYYDHADVVLDARGGFVLPGVINHHVHGLTRGPLMIVGEPPLTDGRVRANLDRLLAQGVTTALNVDGFPTVEDAVAASRLHPVTVKVTTLHTPAHLEWSTAGPFPFGGVRERHRWTLEEMLAAGAPAIGEAGPGVDAHWSDYTLIPEAIAARGGRAGREQARELREAAERGDRETIAARLPAVGLPAHDVGWLLEVHERTVAWRALARRSLEEAVQEARTRGVPMVLHHTPGTFEVVCEAASGATAPLIAGHSNFQVHEPADAVRRAREVRRRGALVDIMSGDAFSAREFHPTPEVTFALLREGLVDLISTDYAGGFWDPMLLVVERAAAAGATTLQDGVRMLTRGPAEAIPGLAPRRGAIAPGLVADLVVTEPGRLSAVREVLVSGQRVAHPPGLW
jgi:alpha-D-ribose 1-methylphosphonate 5-triphosphate diphosphatase PhnM